MSHLITYKKTNDVHHLCIFNETLLILWTQNQTLIDSMVKVSSFYGFRVKSAHRNLVYCRDGISCN
ncbi:unnamed protein product [Spirodela intermedia]|uniref:Uncharacterized protein n=1 Tax=Spirodela intermedia TaxID=51605 RepID=A0A7I8JCR4_SPIIN|nr:unnamed protein product [Spirodela intermedia]CAA6667966.1 unnamed protein product [Spirodela intermedia]